MITRSSKLIKCILEALFTKHKQQITCKNQVINLQSLIPCQVMLKNGKMQPTYFDEIWQAHRTFSPYQEELNFLKIGQLQPMLKHLNMA